MALPEQKTALRRWPLAIGASCVLVVGALFTIRMPTVDTRIEASATAVRVQLAEEWDMVDEIRPTRVLADRLDYVEAPSLDLREITKNSDLRLELDGQLLSLRDLHADRAVDVELESANDVFRWFARGGRVSGTITAQGSWNLALSSRARESLTLKTEPALQDVAISTDFGRDGSSPIPMELRIEGGGAFSLRGARPRRVTFLRERSDRPLEKTHESTIENGTVRIISSTDSFELEARDELELAANKTVRFEIENGPLITVRFEGTASTLNAGPAGNVRDLRPSVLEWMYRDQRLVFLSGAIGSAWLFLWSVYRSFVQ